MPPYGRKQLRPLEWTHFADGTNTADSPHRIGKNQCAAGSQNAMFGQKSTKWRPGTQAIDNTFTGYLRGQWAYLNGTGVDRLLEVNGGYVKVLDKDLTGGSVLSAGAINGDGEAWFADQFGSCFIANGTDVWKLEDTTLYQVGITAPTGVSAAAASGGSLPDGVYQLYACYARRVSGSNVLYSRGQSLGSVTLGSGDNTIAITSFANSTDSQVGNKVIFMTDAGGSTFYRYHQTENNTTTSFNITADTNKSESDIYSVLALDNYRPEAFTQIVCQDKRLWGYKADTLYYSIQASNRYDLERFPASYFIKFEFEITGIFVGGPHLFINTHDGIIKLPYADPSVQPEHTERRWNFKYMRTLAQWHGYVIGLTNDGVKMFDWESGNFLAPDISKEIKPDIEQAYLGWTSNAQPCGVINRRDSRTEYALSFKDNRIGTGGNNVRWVLNLDRFAMMQNNEVRAPWEKWTNGANYLTVDNDGTLFAAQSRETTSLVYREETTHSYDTGIWIADELVTTTNPSHVIYTGRQIPELRGRVAWGPMFAFLQQSASLTVTVKTEEYAGPSSVETLAPVGTVPVFGQAVFGVAQFAQESPARKKAKLSRNMKGHAVYLVIEQSADDPNFELLEFQLEGLLTVSRYT